MKIAMVGIGAIAQKAYLPIMTSLAGVELILCSRDQTVIAQLAQRYRIPNTCTDYLELTAHQVDAVMIHAATTAHETLVAHFLRQRIPVFVDKPLVDRFDRCVALYELAEQQQTPLFVGFNRRYLPMLQTYSEGLSVTTDSSLRSLHWEKHRYDLPGELRTFLFDDFIHPLDSINLNHQSSLDDVDIRFQFAGEQLARLDVCWQVNGKLLSASMNRCYGRTQEQVEVVMDDRVLKLDSLASGVEIKKETVRSISLPDWTPMLASKGFDAMIDHWLSVVGQGVMATKDTQRNLASHKLADALLNRLQAQ